MVLAKRLCHKISPELRRICLNHLDPHERNCLVDISGFTGIIDWEVSLSDLSVDLH